MRSIFFFIALLCSSISMGNAKVVGNGGNVIVCKDAREKVTSVQLLDYFELQQNGGSLQLNPALGDFTAMLKNLLARWKTVAPKRMEQYSKWLDSFISEAGFYSGIEIPPTEDTGVIGIPTGCAIHPAAFQRPDSEIFPGVRRYTLSKDLWDQMSEVQRAGLVLHELIYREAIQSLHATSFATRYLNGYLSSSITPDADTYASIVSQMPLQWVEYGAGFLLEIGIIQTGDSGLPLFYRKGSASSNGYVKSDISSIFANVSAKHLKIDFEELPDWRGDIDYGENHFQLRYLSQTKNLKLKRLFVELHQYSVDIVSPMAATDIIFQEFHDSVEYSSISISITAANYKHGPPFLDLNPANSFYVQPDGSIISSIAKLLPGTDDQGRKVLGPELQTASGQKWIHVPGRPGYVKK